MTSSRVCRVAFVLALVPIVMSAQIVHKRYQAPLKPWAAPLYWQPSQQEREATALRPEAAMTQLPTSPLVFVGITPCRVVDTRAGFGFSGAFGPPSLVGGATRTFPIQSSTACSLPSTASAYSMNITAVPLGVLNFLTVYPSGQPLPLASTLNSQQGQIVSNAVIVAGGPCSPPVPNLDCGSVDVYATDTTDVIIDINGYYVTQPFGYDARLESTAVGFGSLQSNTTGAQNTAVGDFSMSANTTGTGNTAFGSATLGGNSNGDENTAIGQTALLFNRGSYNTAVGAFALATNSGGNDNIAIGFRAAANVSADNSHNIHIGSRGLAGDSGTIRIGNVTLPAPCIPAPCGVQTSFFAAGIRGVTTGNNDAIPVVIDSNGQFGTVNSSRKFKEDIQDMGDASSGLLRLRPVKFRYQKPFADGSKPIQYGLIAEEVEEVYPDLVVHSADGQIQTVKYQVLDSMLLNEVQRQHAKIVSQADQIRALERQLKEQQDRVEKLASTLAAMSVQ